MTCKYFAKLPLHFLYQIDKEVWKVLLCRFYVGYKYLGLGLEKKPQISAPLCNLCKVL